MRPFIFVSDFTRYFVTCHSSKGTGRVLGPLIDDIVEARLSISVTTEEHGMRIGEALHF